MYGGGTPWGHIHQKRATEKSQNENFFLKIENKKLRKILKKLMKKQELSSEDKKYLKEIDL